jgi:hypothetical protein
MQFKNKEQVEKILKDGMVTHITPHSSDRAPEENEYAHKNFRDELDRKGLMYVPATGHWGGYVEPSYAVINMPEEDARDMGSRFNQMSQIHSVKGFNREISNVPHYHPAEGGNGYVFADENGDELQDNYTEVEHPDGTKTRYRLNLSNGAPKDLNKSIHEAVFDGDSDYDVEIEPELSIESATHRW